jgi:hypothetical protein
MIRARLSETSATLPLGLLSLNAGDLQGLHRSRDRQFCDPRSSWPAAATTTRCITIRAMDPLRCWGWKPA